MARRNQFPARQYTETQASCSKCKTMQPFLNFSKDKSSPKGISYWCKTCSSSEARRHHTRRMKDDVTYHTKKRNAHFLHTYGISLAEYEQKLVDQGNICMICGTSLLSTGLLTHLDHDHKTGNLRDFLCTNCNRGLGSFKDSVTNLENAILYLKTHNGSVDTIKEGRCL